MRQKAGARSQAMMMHMLVTAIVFRRQQMLQVQTGMPLLESVVLPPLKPILASFQNFLLATVFYLLLDHDADMANMRTIIVPGRAAS